MDEKRGCRKLAIRPDVKSPNRRVASVQPKAAPQPLELIGSCQPSQIPIQTAVHSARVTESSKLQLVRVAWFYSAVVWAACGILGRVGRTWPVFALAYLVCGLISPGRPPEPKATISFLTSPGLRMAVAGFAAI